MARRKDSPQKAAMVNTPTHVPTNAPKNLI